MINLKNQFLGFCYTNPLFEDKMSGLEQFVFEDIDFENIDFSSLCVADNMPLGKRVEYFFEFYINNSLRYNLIKKKIQIIDNKNTLGEIDFLLFDKKKNKYLHVELTYKYYLYDESHDDELDRYIGPNKKDNLVRKINKLKEKQFPLLYKNESKEYLDEIDLNNIEQKVCFKGNIYLPMHLRDKKPDIINNKCIKGFYISYEDFCKNIENYERFKYFLPHRFDWLSNTKYCEEWKDYNQTKKEIEFFLESNKSPLVWLKNGQNIESIFITWWK